MSAKIKEDIIDGNRKGVVADAQKALDDGNKAVALMLEGNGFEVIDLGADGYSADANAAVALAKNLAAAA